jgi:hypothetical protein
MISYEPIILPGTLAIGVRANNQCLATLGDRARITLSRAYQRAEFAKSSTWRQLRYEDVGCAGAQRCIDRLQGIEKVVCGRRRFGRI